ncbi:hypothetical protein LCGC14_2383940 [marine sediment metagenome]|uniref:Uncharacterized protein n=1 Tax=marine sediment metagenome TaxID=412755 RepID=A0A0F9CM88_9ZZZZ
MRKSLILPLVFVLGCTITLTQPEDTGNVTKPKIVELATGPPKVLQVNLTKVVAPAWRPMTPYPFIWAYEYHYWWQWKLPKIVEINHCFLCNMVRRTMIDRWAKQTIDMYVDQGIPTGSFMHAVLANDLMEAFNRADEQNQNNLQSICSYIQNYIPMQCHGSYKKVAKWIQDHRENPKEVKAAAAWDIERREHYYERIVVHP